MLKLQQRTILSNYSSFTYTSDFYEIFIMYMCIRIKSYLSEGIYKSLF